MSLLLRRAFTRVLLSLAAALAFGPASADGDTIDFSLTDHHGNTFRLQDHRGKVVLIFFGYTLCPDVCPIALQHMATALKRLGQDSKRVRGLFITVDPDHDTPLVLAQYVRYFDAGLVGLTGTRQQIEAVANRFRVDYQKNPGADSRYTMDHTANLFVIDQSGQLSAIVPFGFPAAHIENLLRDMIAAAGK
jgi:cytochrome oxidase Cu insertion factor (SCO1/SenC/PrrC family)